jgi:hypothetical protein
VSTTAPVRFDASTPLMRVLADPRGHEIVERHLPDLVSSSILHTLHGFPIGRVVGTEDALAPEQRAALLEEVAAIDLSVPAPEPERERSVPPSRDYDPAPRGSATASHTAAVARFGRFELELHGPRHGNPFVDVELRARIDGPGERGWEVPGFYDGDGVYRVRYLPEQEGEYRFSTRSNAASLDGHEGSFTVGPAERGRHGPVRVRGTYHFAHADGTTHRPIGTTAYVWNHQGDELEERTLRTLAEGPFNKLRMCVFPKSYLFNENEPERYPFIGDPERGFDHQRFDPAFWRHLERRIDQLAALGIEADLILFHAYDRWGFSTMDPVADDRLVAYAVARLAASANVWWSLANEWDLLPGKSVDDWERFAAIIQRDDPSDHLRSIHNCREFYDQTRPWITHASIQRQDIVKTAEMVTEWRGFGKPVVVDECAYEGNIDQGWGNITGEEMTRRFWEGAIRGGYVGHGETYVHPEDVLWWAKGGELRGSSPERIGFLHRILQEGPAEGLEPSPLDWDIQRAGTEGEQLLYYFGFFQPTYRRFLLDPAHEYVVDVIDTWNMTVERIAGTVRGRFRIDLPGRPYLAVRLTAV